MMKTYVDEDSIYLINIFEEKNKKKLNNSRSVGNIFINYNNTTKNNNNFKLKNSVLSNSYSNSLKYLN